MVYLLMAVCAVLFSLCAIGELRISRLKSVLLNLEVEHSIYRSIALHHMRKENERDSME